MELSEQDRAVVREAVREAVREVFEKLGIDQTNQDAMEAYHADRRYMRASRIASEKIGLAVKITLVTIVISGLVSTLVLGIRTAWKGAP